MFVHKRRRQVRGHEQTSRADHEIGKRRTFKKTTRYAYKFQLKETPRTYNPSFKKGDSNYYYEKRENVIEESKKGSIMK